MEEAELMTLTSTRSSTCTTLWLQVVPQERDLLSSAWLSWKVLVGTSLTTAMLTPISMDKVLAVVSSTAYATALLLLSMSSVPDPAEDAHLRVILVVSAVVIPRLMDADMFFQATTITVKMLMMLITQGFQALRPMVETLAADASLVH